MNAALLIIGIILMILGIPTLVGIYDFSDWIKEEYKKLFNQDVPENFNTIVMAVGWSLVGLGFLLFLIGLAVNNVKEVIIKKYYRKSSNQKKNSPRKIKVGPSGGKYYITRSDGKTYKNYI